MRIVHLLSLISALLSPNQVPGLKDAELVSFAHDFPKLAIKDTFVVDQKAIVRINITNQSILTKTVFKLTGAYVDSKNASKVIRTISSENVQYVVKSGKTINLKYKFIPQIEADNVALLVTVDFYDLDETSYRSVGALQTIRVVYGDSVFDLQSISIYILILGLTALTVYYFFFMEKVVVEKTEEKPRRAKRVPNPKKVTEEPNMDWIPKHNLRASTTKKR